MIHLLFELIRAILSIIITIMIVYVVLSWLIAFEMINRRNPAVNTIWEFTQRVTDPILRPFRSLIPPIGGFDLSVAVVIFILFFLQNNVSWWLENLLRGNGSLL